MKRSDKPPGFTIRLLGLLALLDFAAIANLGAGEIERWRREGTAAAPAVQPIAYLLTPAATTRLQSGVLDWMAALPDVLPGLGEAGEARDYRGVSVDREEFYSALGPAAQSTTLFGFLIFAGAATSLAFLWRRQHSQAYHRQYAVEIERSKLAERLDNLSRYATGIVLLADPAGRILDVNERAVISYGYERHHLLRLTMSELVPAEARPTFERQWMRIVDEGELVFQSDQQRKDSSVFPVEMSSRLIRVGDDMRCQSFILDISGSRAVEERSRLLESAMLQTSDGILIVEVNAAIPGRPDPIFVNPAFERMTGYSLEDLTEGAGFAWQPLHPLPHRMERSGVQFGHSPSRMVQPVWRKDGSAFHAEWNITPLLDKSGRATQCVWICRDITERMQAEEEARFMRSIVESSDDAIIGLNIEGIVVSWNQGAERVFGYSSRDIVGGPISILLPPDRLEESSEIIRKLAQGRSIVHLETERSRKDGRRIFVSLTISPMRDRANQIVGASVIARDIGEWKRSVEQLLEAHRKITSVLESISDGFIALDREWRYTYVNPTAANMLGRTLADLLGRNFWDLWPHAAGSPFGVACRRALAENVYVRVEALFPEPLNAWFEIRCYPSPEGLTVFFTDTSERRRTEQALQLSEERYRSLALATAQIVWTTNPQGEVADDIPMWRAFTGQTIVEIKGLGWLDALHPGDRERTTELWSRTVRTCSFYSTEYRLRRADGEYRWMHVHGVPVLEEGGAIREWVGTGADITERKLGEEEIHRLNMELERRVLQRTVQLQEANKELEAFAYSVSHDLRAPLRAVNGFSNILLEEFAPRLPAEARHYLEVTRKNALQMGELIDGLLLFSQLSRQPLCKQPLAPTDLVQRAWDELRSEHDGRRVEIDIGALAPCDGDALLLKQVFVNLLSNALKYTRKREATRIQVGCCTGPQASSSPVYFVRDNGVGFDIRYKHKLFGVFQRLHRAEDYEGTGVGLATVQRIIHRHGGKVWADAVVNEGAIFYFTLSDVGSAPGKDDNHGG